MAGITGLAQAIINGPEYGRPGKMIITALEDNGGFFLPSQSRDFPWPESLSFTRSANYDSKQIPGGTGELHQWTGTTANEFSLTFKLMRDIRPRESLPIITRIVVDPQSQTNQAHNRDIMLDIEFLSQFVLPKYSSLDGYMLPKPPPLIMVQLEGLKIGYAAGNDYMICVATGITWEIIQSFPDGTPRIATVELPLKETFYDSSGNIVMHDRSNLLLDRFNV